MLIFRQGLDEIVEIASIDQLFYQVAEEPTPMPYPTDQILPDFANNPGKFYYPTNNYPQPDDATTFFIGSHHTYIKTQQTFSTGQVTNFGMCCLPTPPTRNADTVIYYKPLGTTMKVMVTSKTWEPGTGQHAFINDPSTLSLVIYNGANKDVYGNTSVEGHNTVTSYSVQPIAYDNMLDEDTIISTLNEVFFTKEWVEKYINDRLNVVIPQAVDEAVKQSEIVISQRYVSR